MNKLTGVILSNDSAVRSELSRVLPQIDSLHLLSPALPLRNTREIDQLFDWQPPSVCFLDIADQYAAQQIATLIMNKAPSTQLVAVGSASEAGLIRPALRSGMKEFLSRPFTVAETREVVERVRLIAQGVAAATEYPLYAFCPLSRASAPQQSA